MSELNYYQRNKDMILNTAQDYYENDKGRLRKQARDKYRNFSKKKKRKRESMEETDTITCPKKRNKD